MKSPLTGKEMPLRHELRAVTFRKDEVKIRFQFFLCEDSGEKFTTTELDELNLLMVEHAYRTKNHIPQRAEITDIREKYELSALRMGEILGFGQNTYGLYEKGDLPSLANANLIKLARDPLKFKSLVDDWDPKSDKVKSDLLKRIDRLVQAEKLKMVNLDDYLIGDGEANEFTGFTKPNMEKLVEMIVYFAHKVPSYKTKMNKLLFYADFLMFRVFGNSISGAKYVAIDYGPVPNMYETIFENLAVNELIDVFYESKENGSKMEKLMGRADRPIQLDVFSAEELQSLEKVVLSFQNSAVSEIVEISHQEIGWLENKNSKRFISYEYALELKAI
ncbi:type II toxin-antitoxin system antitoxin SocA domain-containing protein [Algoriphagus aquimarinus]|uniref:Putative zinc finger/helix-turn-helix protein, YgiT family n=1 Tax=Algoriphagus aquimarinus TaxID=237018 RepID=A0A1I0Y1A9_9BACT|nr:type II toxin-antitoxin system antitoxin SocA domain-containing protein [Algoriphagus aquimarinus]SFB07139.1 putative zinc finger/helix-turn-helix protein, YgiT family [Algoriphagus aquimarinus]